MRARYASDGRARDFDQILGDGTIWLILLSSFAMLREKPERYFVRNLALRDLVEHSLLLATVVPAQLAPLARRLWHGSEVDVPTTVGQISVAFNALEHYLRGRFEDCKLQSAASVRGGDWLWNPKVGFAQILDVEDSRTAKVHIRKYAENRSRVLMSYYVNLRLASQKDPTLAGLVSGSLLA